MILTRGLPRTEKRSRPGIDWKSKQNINKKTMIKNKMIINNKKQIIDKSKSFQLSQRLEVLINEGFQSSLRVTCEPYAPPSSLYIG